MDVFKIIICLIVTKRKKNVTYISVPCFWDFPQKNTMQQNKSKKTSDIDGASSALMRIESYKDKNQNWSEKVHLQKGLYFVQEQEEASKNMTPRKHIHKFLAATSYCPT